MKLFLVDDSVLIQNCLEVLVSDFPEIEIVGRAETPLEAIKGIRELKPDAVILDIRLKEGSGFDVLLNIKAEDPSPVVIMLTNYPYVQYREKSMELGADYFFDKSTEFDEIAPIFKRMIQDARRNHPAEKNADSL